MSTTWRVYVDGRGLDVPAGATVLDAVRAASPATADQVAAGERTITDSRGLPVASDGSAYSGAIYRVVAVRHRTGGSR